MQTTLYDALGLKGKSILKSVFIREFTGDPHANIRIEVEAYDETFTNAVENKGIDYVTEQLDKQLEKAVVRNKIIKHLNLKNFEGALVTVYDASTVEYYRNAEGRRIG